MLALARQVGRSVFLKTSDGMIRVTVTKQRGEWITLGFEAPDNVEIARDELIGIIGAKHNITPQDVDHFDPIIARKEDYGC